MGVNSPQIYFKAVVRRELAGAMRIRVNVFVNLLIVQAHIRLVNAKYYIFQAGTSHDAYWPRLWVQEVWVYHGPDQWHDSIWVILKSMVQQTNLFTEAH